MASTSSIQKSFKYEVFLSFRGEDVRKTFVDHLYHALNQRGIITYKDDEKIKKGERINEQLLKAIENSKFYIVVFSKNYASSSWCLDELVKIMECQKTIEQTAYLVFYDVEPTEVRHQSGAVGEAFAKLVAKGKRKRIEEDADLEKDVGRWKNALKDAADLAGWELKNTVDGHEAKFIEKIIEEISPKLHFISLNVDDNLVGMENRVSNVVSSLKLDADDVQMIGIRGIGGGGKTTLARAIFDHISIRFESKSFVENVREGSKGSGLKELQKQVLQDVLNDQKLDVKSVYEGKSMMKKMMHCKKVLMVLDDVDHIEQLEALAKPNWFKPGSRIIITTRDEQVLIAHKVNFIHDVNLLSNEEAISLFSRYAFGREVPSQGYEELSRRVVHYAAGLPLTIKVLGSHLSGRSELEWVDATNRLKNIPLKETLEKLELSYNGLENDQKEIFLDVVCILKGETKDRAIRTLESCGFNAHIGLRVLEQKSLITISNWNGCLGFHDHIEEMGKNIVRRSHPNEPGRHGRLWIKEEIEDVLVNELGTKATRSIRLSYVRVNPITIMKGLKKMKELRILLQKDVFFSQCFHEDAEVSQYLPNSLQSLCWIQYPFRSLPEKFQANKLVNLEMCRSNIRELWEGGERKVLNKLRFVDLRYSKLRTFDLRATPHLEELYLEGCGNLVELQFSVKCMNLKVLNLSGSKVINLNLRMFPRLEELNLQGCRDLEELHVFVECLNLKVLNLGGSKVINPNLVMFPHLEELYLKGCRDLEELHVSVECTNLKVLNLGGSKVINLNLGMFPHLEELNLEGCRDLEELHMSAECLNLKSLNLSGSKVIYLNLGMFPHLEELNLEGCRDFEELHMSVECPTLKVLNLICSRVSNINLGLAPHLEILYLLGCSNLRELHAPVGCLEKLVAFPFQLDNCLNFEKFVVNIVNESANPDYLVTFIIDVVYVEVCPVHPKNNLQRFRFDCLYDEPGSSWTGNFEKLISFGPCVCENLEYILATICDLQHLRELTLEGGIPQDLWRLQSLEKLCLEDQRFHHLPDSICMLKHLKSLELDSCSVLEQLPENICELGCLEELLITECESLQDIPDSICKMKCLKWLELSDCHNIMKLPEEVGSLECLKLLRIEGTGISSLPQSIYQLKGLRIDWSREELESNGFTSILEDSCYEYVEL